MLSFEEGTPIAYIKGGKYHGEILHIIENGEEDEDFKEISMREGVMQPLMNPKQRSVTYIAGPAGSGKTTYALDLIKRYKKMFPKKLFCLFSRTDYESDPAFGDLKPCQISIDESLLENPIDITEELEGGSIILFDDCNTIQNDALKKMVEKLMADAMEIGRKLDINMVVTNHLVIPNEKKSARTIMNELNTMTIFPKSGSSQQIMYALKNYFGLSKEQIVEILNLPSRWVTISKSYPMYVIYDKGAYIL